MTGSPAGGRIAASALLFLTLLAGAAAVSAADAQKLRPLVHHGEKAPEFVLKDIDGKRVVFRPGHGKAALVVFWALSAITDPTRPRSMARLYLTLWGLFYAEYVFLGLHALLFAA